MDLLLSLILLAGPWILLPFLLRFELKIFVNLVLVLCSISFALGILEVLLRVGLFQSDYAWTPQKYFNLKEKLRVQAREEAKGNPLTFRDAHIDPVKPPNTIRIAALGDSFVWGTGLVDSDRWSRRLESRLAAVDSRIQTLHWGREAWSAKMAINAFKTHHQTWKIDLALLSFNSNDTDMGDFPQWELNIGYGTSVDPFNPIRRVFPEAGNFLGGQLRRFIETRDPRYGYANWENKLWAPENLAKFTEMIADFYQYLAEHDVPCVVALLPTTADPYYGERMAVAEKMFKEVGFDVVNLYPLLHSRVATISEDRIYAHRGDRHPGPGITEIYAEGIANHLVTGTTLPKLLAELNQTGS